MFVWMTKVVLLGTTTNVLQVTALLLPLMLTIQTLFNIFAMFDSVFLITV